MVVAQVVSQRDDQRGWIDAGLTANGRCFVTVQGGVAELFDDYLHVIGSREVPDGRLLAASQLDRLVIGSDDSVHLIGDRHHVLSDLPADAACLLGELVLISAPTTSGHRLHLVDAESGTILDRVEIDADDAAAFIYPHPSNTGAVVDFAMGQDGVLAYWVEIIEGSLAVREILPALDPVIAGFNSTGTRLLVLPHPSDPEQALVLDWPTLEVTGKLSTTDLQTGIGIDLHGCWIDDQRVALYAMEDSLVVASDSLTEPTRVKLPVDFADNGDIMGLQHLGNSRVAVDIWTPARRSTMLLEFPSSQDS